MYLNGPERVNSDICDENKFKNHSVSMVYTKIIPRNTELMNAIFGNTDCNGKQ